MPTKATNHHKLAAATGLQLILQAAAAHGESSEPDHEVGDLQQALRAAWDLMDAAQRMQLLGSDAVREQILNELPCSDPQEQLDAAIAAEGPPAASSDNIVSRLLAAFPGFVDDSDVNGADLVDWVGKNLGALRAATQRQA